MVMKIIKRCYTGLIFAFLYAPIVVLIVFSFNASKSTAHWEGFSFKWYIELFHDRQILKALYNTIMIALTSSLIATVVGTFAAFGLTQMRPSGRKFILGVNNLPILNPDIVTGIALMTLFIFAGVKLGFLTMLMAHITFSTPYVILSVLPKFRQMPTEMLDAAMDLGATPWYAFKKVIVPEIMPGIITGFLIAFTLSIDDFVISFFTTGGGVSNLSIEIYAMARRGIKPMINALSTLMFITVLSLLLVVNHRSDRDLAIRSVKSTKLEKL
jgi:spermidine/putrescine transport system permease protein